MAETKFDSRLQVKLTPEEREKLDELIQRTGARDVADMVRDAFRIYDIITQEIFVDGNQVLLREGETGEVFRLTLWEKEAKAA